jgi:hypothetical protein
LSTEKHKIFWAFPVQTLILTASVIWRDSIAAQVPDQNSRMSWRKAAPRHPHKTKEFQRSGA